MSFCVQVDDGDPDAAEERVNDPCLMKVVNGFKSELLAAHKRGDIGRDPLWQSTSRTVPNPLLMQNPPAGLAAYSGATITFIAWDIFFPKWMERVFGGSKMPPCPCCHSPNLVTSDGWPPYVRRVVGVDGMHFFLSKQYRCGGKEGKAQCPGQPLTHRTLVHS